MSSHYDMAVGEICRTVPYAPPRNRARNPQSMMICSVAIDNREWSNLPKKAVNEHQFMEGKMVNMVNVDGIYTIWTINGFSRKILKLPSHFALEQ